MSEQQTAATPFKPFLLDLLHQAWLGQSAFLQELSDEERAAIGTPDNWSAKDHLAHMTFWKQRLTLKLRAAIHGEAPSTTEKHFEEFNSEVFEERRLSPWSELLSEAEQAHKILIDHVQQLSEEDLVAFQRFDWAIRGEPLGSAIVDTIYEHTLSHLAQYSIEHQNLARAIQLFESWTARVVQPGVPAIVQGQLLYNLACFYALHDQLNRASICIQHALTLYPDFKELALADPDLTELRAQFV